MRSIGSNFCRPVVCQQASHLASSQVLEGKEYHTKGTLIYILHACILFVLLLAATRAQLTRLVNGLPLLLLLHNEKTLLCIDS